MDYREGSSSTMKRVHAALVFIGTESVAVAAISRCSIPILFDYQSFLYMSSSLWRSGGIFGTHTVRNRFGEAFLDEED